MAPGSNAMTLKRINREIKDLAKEDLGDMALEPTADNMFIWKASIPGPEGSPYEGGAFELKVELASDYPFSAPKVTFITRIPLNAHLHRIYHMNVSDRGNICIDILKQNWSPALSLYKVVLSLSSLLTDPNPKDPLVPAIASEYIRNRTKHDSTAREWTRLYAQKPKEMTSSPSHAKGKARANPMPAENGPSRRAGRAAQPPSATNGEVIDLIGMVEDSRSGAREVTKANALAQATPMAGVKRRRGSGDAPESGGSDSRRRRIGSDGVDDVIVIED